MPGLRMTEYLDLDLDAEVWRCNRCGAELISAEFYCPGCGVQIETEYLPPGHPVTVDIELDIDRLKRRIAAGEVRVSEGRLVAPDREGERR